MLSIPDTIWPHLLAGTRRFAVIYEAELVVATIHLAAQELDWPVSGGNEHTAIAVAQGPIVETMKFTVPHVEVTFSNVELGATGLRQFLTPTDQFTGRPLVVRLLIRDVSDVLLDDSVVLFKGIIEQPRLVSETKLKLTAVGQLDSADIRIPKRNMGTHCPWDYANGNLFDGSGECRYMSTTTADGAGAGSTTLIVQAGDGAKFGDSVGRDISIDGGTPVAIVSVVTDTITLAEARTWADTNAVRFNDCNRELSDCVIREIKHLFGGFTGITHLSRARWRSDNFSGETPDLSLPGM